MNPDADVGPKGSTPVRYQIMEQIHVTGANFQKEIIFEYERNSKKKSQEYFKFLTDKKSLIIISFKQCDKATQIEISLGATHTVVRKTGRLLAFIEQTGTVCFGGDDG